MFGRRKREQPAERAKGAEPARVVEKVGGKNRPTPKRSQQQALNKRPLVPSDRKAAAKAQRDAARAQRVRAREAMMTGDERFLPPRDKGPVRRFVRDFVDARYNVGEFFLVVALVVVFTSLLLPPQGQVAVTGILWLTILVVLLDGFVLSRQLKKRLNAKFGEENVPAGSVRYGVMRALQLRRTRLPKPTVRRGQYPT